MLAIRKTQRIYFHFGKCKTPLEYLPMVLEMSTASLLLFSWLGKPGCATQDVEIKLRGDILPSAKAENTVIMEVIRRNPKQWAQGAKILPRGKYSQAPQAQKFLVIVLPALKEWASVHNFK